MPGNKKKSVVTIKKVKSVKRRRTNILRGPFKNYVKNDPFPPYRWVNLRYTGTFLMSTGTGVYGTEQVFRLNSLYDTDFTNAGHQPYGFDQMATLYNSYIVDKAYINLEISNPSNDGLIVSACIQPSAASFSLTGKGVEAITEQPMVVTRRLNNSGSQKTSIRQSIPMWIAEGISKIIYEAEINQYGATVGANPSAVPYLRFAACSDSGTAGHTVTCVLTLTFHAKFYDRIQQSQS